MKKIFANLLLLFNGVINAQQDITLKNITPPSPEASAFVKYGTYPIGTYTGKPDITIPVYEIKTGKLSVPISLSYDATGIRVNDMASWVGMNWSLDVGGMVSEMVVGQPDIASSTGLDAVPPRASEIVNTTSYFNYLQSLVDGDVMAPANPDAEPDKFFYSFNGRSGSFVFDRSRNIMQIPKTSLKISVIGSIQGFNITDENGMQYIFTFLERTESYSYYASGSAPGPSANGSTYKNQITGYYLTEIISNDGIEHIYFSYENGLTTSRDDMYDESYGDAWISGDGTRTSNYHQYVWKGVRRVVTIPRLKTISFSNGKVEFSRVANRQDDGALSSSSRLDEIIIYQKNGTAYTKLKSFKFSQGYYYSSATYGQYSGLPNETVDRYRLRLDNLKMRDAVGNDISSYQFIYNNTELPPKTSCSQDWWGYYNGKPNTTLVPTTVIPDGNGGTLTIGSADRNSDETYMKAGILEKIIYPTGGYTTFETESHKIYTDYDNVGETHNAYAQGLSGTNLNIQTFTAPSLIQASSGVLMITIGPYSSSDPPPFVKIKNLSTGQEQTISSTDMTQWFSTTVSYNFTPGNTYELTASCYVNQSYGMANLIASFTKTIYNPHTNLIGGLRIKSIKNYNADNTLANEENYKYGQNENGGGVFVGIEGNAYSYQRSQVAWYLYQNNWLGNCFTSYGYKQIFSGGALYDQALVQGSPVVYTDVVKYYGTTTSNTGKTVYYYGTANQQWAETRPLPSGQQLANNQGILIINDTWKKGQLLNQQEHKRNTDGTYSLVQEAQNAYNILYTDSTYGLIAQTKFDRVVISPQCLQRSFSDYAFAEYPIYTGYLQLAQTIKKTYSGSDYIQTTLNHIYDDVRKDIEIKTSTTNSKGQTIESEKKYPFHKSTLLTSITPAESTALDDMVTKNIIAPIEEIQRNNTIQMLLKKTSYEYVNGTTIAPVNIKYQIKSNPIETRLQFTKYDSYGNLVEQSKTNDVIKTYIWGYNNTYPIAEIIGVTYNTAIAVLNQNTIQNPSSDQVLRNELNNLRTSFPFAQVTTYTYRPLVGITSQTDINNRTTYYIYDAFSRLAFIKDKDGDVIKKICYNYLGQPGDCSIYGNVTKTGTYTKECPQGQAGTQVTYTVPEKTYYASTQADADALAQNDVYTNGQAYANANGSCNAPLITVNGHNYTSEFFYTGFTNTSTSQVYYLYMYPNSDCSAQMPSGTYNVAFYQYGSTYTYFNINGYSTYGTSATFNNVTIGNGSYAQVGY